MSSSRAMEMDIINQESTSAYNTAGERLSHILDQIGFKQGRGRVIDFQHYLTDTSPKHFKHLKYTTVRAWFQDHAPPMRKIDAIIDALQVNYHFNHDLSHIKTWWKAGGYYPFYDKTPHNHPSIHELVEKISTVKEKLPFLIMSIVTDETGELFKTLSGSELIHISDKAIGFMEHFMDPLMIECPDEYIRLVVRNEVKKVLNSRS